jgi:ribosomal-protein-alanine N-acetyltransferase
MQPGDLPVVQSIDRLSFALPWPASAFEYELYENTASLTLVAEQTPPGDAPEVVGMAVVWLILDEAHIATIGVHPLHRRQGVGRRLLARALQLSQGRGAAAATLEVRAGNLGAQALYRQFGFEEVGRRPRYYRDNNEDAILMTLFDLSPWAEKTTPARAIQPAVLEEDE